MKLKGQIKTSRMQVDRRDSKSDKVPEEHKGAVASESSKLRLDTWQCLLLPHAINTMSLHKAIVARTEMKILLVVPR